MNWKQASRFDVPVQRRKARGKSLAAQGKLIELAAKRRFTVDKIRTEVLAAYAALTAAFERLERAQESRRLAVYLADVENRKFQLGESDLLSVVLREQFAIEAAEAEVDALLEYYSAKCRFRRGVGSRLAGAKQLIPVPIARSLPEWLGCPNREKSMGTIEPQSMSRQNDVVAKLSRYDSIRLARH